MMKLILTKSTLKDRPSHNGYVRLPHTTEYSIDLQKITHLILKRNRESPSLVGDLDV